MTDKHTKKFSFFIEGAIVPKERPRFDGKRAYMSNRYMSFKKETAMHIQQQATGWLGVDFPIIRSSIEVILFAQNQKKDGDNCLGSIMDCLKLSGIIKDDSLINVPKKIVTSRLLGKEGALIAIAVLPNFDRKTLELEEATELWPEQDINFYAKQLGRTAKNIAKHLALLES